MLINGTTYLPCALEMSDEMPFQYHEADYLLGKKFLHPVRSKILCPGMIGLRTIAYRFLFWKLQSVLQIGGICCFSENNI